MKKFAWPRVLRVACSIVLGAIAPLVAFLGGSIFEVQGENSFREILSGSVAAALYLAYCQFWVAPRGRGGLAGKWSTVLILPIPWICCLGFLDRPAVLFPGLPIAAGGVLGSVVGALLVGRMATRADAGPGAGDKLARWGRASRNLWIGAAVVLGVALVLAAGVIPPVKSDISPMASPHQASEALRMVAYVNLFAAALLAGAALWYTRHARVSVGLLGVWAVLSFLLALVLLAPALAYLGHGTTAMRVASGLLFACVAAEILGAALATFTRVVADRAAPASA
jgi:hypothetical protein